MELYGTIWTLVESLGFTFVIIIFFMDPIRRWNFFGYRPTAVMGLYDPMMEKVLVSKINGAWSFNQGGMYGNNIYITANSILRRELGIPETRFKLVYTMPLGSMRIKNKFLLKRARISTISLFGSLRGKGYMGCFIRINLDNIKEIIQKGAGVQEVRVVSVEEARRLVQLPSESEEHSDKKRKMIIRMLDEMAPYMKGVKKWETQALNAEDIKEAVQKEKDGESEKGSEGDKEKAAEEVEKDQEDQPSEEEKDSKEKAKPEEKRGSEEEPKS